MSRRIPQPQNIPMQAAMMHPYGAVDFVDNSLSSSVSASPAGFPGAPVAGLVVGGPPAFLEAHGIRYVPADVPEPSDPVEPLASAAVLERDTAPVSDMDIDSRVQSSVQAFLSRSSGSALPRASSRLAAQTSYHLNRAAELPMASSRLAAETERRLSALRNDVMASEIVGRRSSRARGSDTDSRHVMRDEIKQSKLESGKRTLKIELNGHEVDAIKSNPEAMRRIDAAVSREVQRSMASSNKYSSQCNW